MPPVLSLTCSTYAWSTSSLPLTLTYANHGRYLGEQDQELSAHFGVSFKLGDKEVRKLADGS